MELFHEWFPKIAELPKKYAEQPILDCQYNRCFGFNKIYSALSGEKWSIKKGPRSCSAALWHIYKDSTLYFSSLLSSAGFCFSAEAAFSSFSISFLRPASTSKSPRVVFS